jgi:hypothetical protein
LAEQLEAERILFDLTVASFEPLTPGSAGNVVGKKEKLAEAICPGYGVLGYRGAGFKGLFTSGLRPAGQRRVSC